MASPFEEGGKRAHGGVPAMSFADIAALLTYLDTRELVAAVASPTHTSSRSVDELTDEPGQHSPGDDAYATPRATVAAVGKRRAAVRRSVPGRRRLSADRPKRRAAAEAELDEPRPAQPASKRPRRAAASVPAGGYVEGPEADEAWIKTALAGWDATVGS